MPEAAPAFHDAFAAALAGDASALAAGWGSGADLDAGLTVYRNTIAKGCADALTAQFPTVEKLVGEAWLAAAAIAFAKDHPPRQASLLTYGQEFPDWLAAFPPAADLPHLPAIARLDLMWTDAHLAADAEPLPAGAFAALGPDDLGRLTAELHPATRFARFDLTLPALWRALQAEAAPEAFELDETPQGLLMTRPRLDIEHRVIGPGACAFLAALTDRRALADAAGLALAAEPDLALDTAFAELIALGAFGRLIPAAPNRDQP
ncbi:MAG: DUF2063 domain-containing protein [Phenylobacterium sp.]|uniref:HvfC/BufC family peptide modification chaperone n=1 Tax=Phenylobacterium sp. TaxID=1871053 RepID=UPI0025E5E78E|nr:putative DNA-binding domain-containing protein [Phenylobacterium sp.]MBI1200662.1 DUF2063 domain-containing protein [Phenylobacterium sp.]